MASAREARRRRIVERGTDRLAFITGESRSLPPAPTKEEDPQQIGASFSEESVTTGSESSNHQDQAVNNSVEHNADNREELLEKNETNMELSEHEEIEKFSKCKMGKQFTKLDRNNEATTNTQNTASTELSTSSNPRALPDPTHRVFTPSRISRSISSSENMRILCAIVIALLVVLSGHGYSLGGSTPRGLISFSPFFLVLLTDITIVLCWLLMNSGEEVGRRDEGCGLSKALEAGLTIQKALDAASMDCSICAVVMISGLVI